jgi:assimilatory nitrate reductase catalytic subunit
LKHAAVKILKAELPWSLLAMAWLDPDRALDTREQLKALMGAFPFTSCVPFGRERSGLLFRAAGHEAPDPATLARLEALLSLDGTDSIRYADARRGQRRVMRLARQGQDARLEAFLLAGDTRSQAWIRALLQDELPAQAYGRLLLAPGAQAPVAVQARGGQVCTCFNVTEDAIRERLAATPGEPDTRLAALQAGLQCGTNCGSCIPELRRLVRAHPAQAVPA